MQFIKKRQKQNPKPIVDTQCVMVGALETQQSVYCLPDVAVEELLLLVIAFKQPPTGSSLGGEAQH